jgi:hypothetical protein
MPLHFFECGSEINLTFNTMYSVGDDTVWVRAGVGEIGLAEMPLTGAETSYQEKLLELNIGACIGNLRFTWSCTRTEATDDDWFFLLDDIEPSLVVGGEGDAPLPSVLSVEGPWPNPSARTTSWSVALPKDGELLVEIHDIAGRRVRDENMGAFQAGEHMVTLASRGLASGLYVATFKTNKQACTKLFVRLRE